MEFAASGTNLQAANHVILLEPPGVNPAHGVAQETQAIGRAARLGQERVINVTRFVINDSIESDLFKQNEQQRMANERTRRFCCSESDETPAQASQPAAAAAGSTESIDIACSLMPPDPSCFELRGASAAPAQSSEPTLLSTSCPSEADVSKLRSLLLAAAAEHFPLSAGCTLSLFFAGRQLADNNSLVSLKIERNCQLQGMLRNAKPAPAENESTDVAAANSPATRESAVIDLSQSESATCQGSEEPEAAAQSDPAEAAEEDLSTDEIDGLKVVELRAELKRRGCVSSGRRAALLARLKAKVAEPQPTQRTGRKRRRDDVEAEELISPAASPVENPDASPDNGQSNGREIPTGEPPEQQSQSDSAAQQSTQQSRAADSPDSPSRDSPPRDTRSRSGDESRQLLVGMGFEAARSEAALQAAEGDVERAAVLLAEGFTEPQHQAHAVVPATAGAAAGDSMERSRGPSTASASARAAQPAPKRPHSFDLTSPNEAGQDLAVLQDICHCDATVASRALSASGGDLQRAISTLLYRSSVL